MAKTAASAEEEGKASASRGFVDPVDVFLRKSNTKEEAAQLLSFLNPTPSAEPSVESLRFLTGKMAWGAVLEVSGSILHSDDQPDDGLKFEAMTFRIAALIQTRQIDRAMDQIHQAMEQLSSLRNNPKDIVIEGQSDAPRPNEKDNQPVTVPFELKALSADALSRKGSPKALELFYELLAVAAEQARGCQERGQDEAAGQWQRREQVLLSALSAYYLRVHQPDAAVDIARELARKNPDSTLFNFALVRVLVHAGKFATARKMLVRIGKLPSATQAELHLHRGLIFAAEGNYDAALDEFEADLLLDPYNVPAANNAAICLLQMGRLTEAVERLEKTLRDDSFRALDEGLMFNLCTLYDLSQPDRSKEKKTVLRKLAARFGRQGFNMESITI